MVPADRSVPHGVTSVLEDYKVTFSLTFPAVSSEVSFTALRSICCWAQSENSKNIVGFFFFNRLFQWCAHDERVILSSINSSVYRFVLLIWRHTNAGPRLPCDDPATFLILQKKRVQQTLPIISIIKHSLVGANWKTCNGENEGRSSSYHQSSSSRCIFLTFSSLLLLFKVFFYYYANSCPHKSG